MRGISFFRAPMSATSVLRMVTIGFTTCAAFLSFIVPAQADGNGDQWYLAPMKAEEMWKVSKGSGIEVAVVDSGVNRTSALSGRLHAGKDFSGASGGSDKDTVGHGTGVAELIAGNGKGGNTQGLAPEAEILSFRTTGDGIKEGRDDSTLADSIRAAADSKAKIINLSVASYSSSDDEDAIKYAQKKGKLLIAGSGNHGTFKGKIQWPAAYDGVLGVSAVDESSTVSKLSKTGWHVDLAAPGVDMPVRCRDAPEKHCTSQGTSLSTAITSASAALIWSKHPDWTANQVARVLIGTTNMMLKGENPSNQLGYGIVRPRNNLLYGKGNPGLPDDPVFAKNGDFIRPTASPSPSQGSTAPDGKEDAGKHEDAKGGGSKDSAAAADSGDSNVALWGGVGALAVAAVAGVVLTVVLRGRRRS